MDARNQRLDINFRAEGKKECITQAKFYVKISYGKSVVMCKACNGRLNAERYCEIIIPRIDDGRQNRSSSRAKRILQNSCPVMNSRSVVDALTDTGDMCFKIPVHTPDINCIENVFHTMHKEIQQDVVEQGILKETFLQFQKGARNFIRDFNVYYIDRVFESMWKRIELVVK